MGQLMGKLTPGRFHLLDSSWTGHLNNEPLSVCWLLRCLLIFFFAYQLLEAQRSPTVPYDTTWSWTFYCNSVFIISIQAVITVLYAARRVVHDLAYSWMLYKTVTCINILEQMCFNCKCAMFRWWYLGSVHWAFMHCSQHTHSWHDLNLIQSM